jgi:archaeal flagellin FlaB
MHMHKKAEMGMGTLIIFIAMILVAAVAASVLITTTGSLQNKALDTGRSTTQEVGTSIQVIELYGEDGSDTNLEDFYMTLKLSAGSDPIRFADLLLTLGTSNQTEDYEYQSSIDCADVDTFNVTTGFGVSYSITGSSNRTGYLTRGDVAKICFEAPYSIGESSRIEVSIIPKVGSPRIIATTTPDLILRTRETLFP